MDSAATNYDSEAKKDDGTCAFEDADNGTSTPTNYIKRGDDYYEITEANIVAGLYDGGPNYYISIFLNDAESSFAQDSDNPTAFSGSGSAAFIHLATTDSLESGTFTPMGGWAATNSFDFDNINDSIYDHAYLFDQYTYLEEEDVVFSTTMGATPTYSVYFKDEYIEINYSGAMTFIVD
ncbi:MAG: hypothetical protein HRT71_15270 [Flavobacteriales bacterium]|nr:hypothetical protein [Flavobacteriales bacterium]